VHAYGPQLPRWRTVGAAALWGIVLQSSKMRGLRNFAICPSRWIFGDAMPCNELTKTAGWKSDCSCDPLHSFRANAPAPLEKFAHTPKKSFATQSPRKGPFAALPRNDAVGHKRTLRAAANSVHSMNSTVMGRPGAAGLTGVVPVLPITSLCDSAQNLATAKRLLLQEAHNAHCALDP
jgi:hypothetical protein